MFTLRSRVSLASGVWTTLAAAIVVGVPNTTLGQSHLPPCVPEVVWTDCQGIDTFPNGGKYVGEFKDGKYNGESTFTFSDGQKYVGEFKDGKYHGQGTFTFANGSTYVGDWKEGKYDGRGTLYAADGSIKQSGIWKDNIFVQALVPQ